MANGHTKNRHRMRCNECRRQHRKKYGADIGARFTLRRHPDKYARPVRCPVCRSTDVSSIQATWDRKMARRAARGAVCRCTSYPFPHDAGSLRMCTQHPLVDVEPTAEEWERYENCLATKRQQWQ